MEESPPPPTASSTGRERNIVRGIGWLSVQGILTSLLGFVLLASLLRLLPSATYGAYSSLQVSVGIAATVATFGFNASVVKFLAPSAAEEGGSGWGGAKASLVMSTSLSAVVSLALAGAAPYLSDYFMKSVAWSWVFYLGAFWLFSLSVSNTLLGVLQAARRYGMLAKVLFLSKFAGVAVAVAGLLVAHSLAVAIFSWAVYYGILGLSALSFYWRPLLAGDARPYYRPVLRYAYPLALAAIAGSVTANADIVVVGGYLNPTSLGVYNATVIISGIVSALFLAPLTTALFAETSFSSETPSEVSRGLRLAFRFGALAILPSTFFASAMAAQLFDLFSGGGAYAGGIPYLQLIILFYAFAAVETISLFVLQGVGKTRHVLAVGVVAALGEIGLSVSLVPSLGLAGAAYSRVAVEVAGCLLSLYFLRAYLPRVNFGFAGKALLSSAIPAVAVYLPSVDFSSRVITIVPYTVIGIALFVVCARALKLLSAEDKSYLGHLLPGGLQWVLRLL